MNDRHDLDKSSPIRFDHDLLFDDPFVEHFEHPAKRYLGRADEPVAVERECRRKRTGLVAHFRIDGEDRPRPLWRVPSVCSWPL